MQNAQHKNGRWDQRGRGRQSGGWPQENQRGRGMWKPPAMNQKKIQHGDRYAPYEEQPARAYGRDRAPIYEAPHAANATAYKVPEAPGRQSRWGVQPGAHQIHEVSAQRNEVMQRLQALGYEFEQQ